MSVPLQLVATRIFNTPLVIHPDKAEVILTALAPRLHLKSMTRLDGSTFAFDDDDYFTPPEQDPEEERVRKDGYDLQNGLAIIPVEGTLVHKLGSMRPYSGMTGYDGIKASLFNALDDDEVRGVLFDIDSPGGEVSGCFDLADTIYGVRGVKPMRAVCDEMACSAAYAIASAADRVTLPRTAYAGSIGVIFLHIDLSKALAKDGISVTMLKYGAAKFEGNEFEPLRAETIERFQREIDRAGEMFVALVARNRSLDPKAVRATEGASFAGDDVVDLGLADAVESADETFLDFAEAVAAEPVSAS